MFACTGEEIIEAVSVRKFALRLREWRALRYAELIRNVFAPNCLILTHVFLAVEAFTVVHRAAREGRKATLDTLSNACPCVEAERSAIAEALRVGTKTIVPKAVSEWGGVA